MLFLAVFSKFASVCGIEVANIFFVEFSLWGFNFFFLVNTDFFVFLSFLNKENQQTQSAFGAR